MALQKFDTIVVGAGINGLSTSWYLAHKLNKKVLLLEQFPFPHTRGSSHGHTRITRRNYAEPHFAALMQDAYPLWAEVEKLSGDELFIKCGQLKTGSDSIVTKFEDTMREFGYNFRSYSGPDVARLYPQMANFEGQKFLYDPEAGILLADKCLRALLKCGQQSGVVFRDMTKVTHIDSTARDTVVVTTNRGEYHARSVVITAGSWSQKVLGQLNLNLPLRPLKVCLSYWKIRDSHAGQYHISRFPTFSDEQTGHMLSVYATPEFEYPGHMKVAYHIGTPIDPDKRDVITQFKPEELAFIRDYVSKHFPGLEPEIAVAETCIFTNSPDDTFILDRHPLHPNIVYGCGFSGTGFKTGPAVGKILGRLASDLDPEHDMRPFSANRFPHAELKSKL